MPERFVMRFQGSMTKFPEDALNKYLKDHPEYRIVCMTYVNQSSLYTGLIVYFEQNDNISNT